MNFRLINFVVLKKSIIFATNFMIVGMLGQRCSLMMMVI